MIEYDDIPDRMARLPRNKAGYPVPWFVAVIDGVPDFRVVRPGGIEIALRKQLCWVCGRPFRRGEDRAFVIGPMCAVNRVSSEPPSHRSCAVWSAVHCPFMANPGMVRRDRNKPEDAVNPAGIMIARNPGVGLVWVTGHGSWHTFSDGAGGTLFNIGRPKAALWFAHGRPATRSEVLASIDSGLPILRQMAVQDGQAAVAELESLHERALALIPAEAATT